MDFFSLPLEMQNEVKKLASEYPVSINLACKYYMMGGYEHAKELCELKLMNMPEEVIEWYNYQYSIENNKKSQEELYGLLPWHSKLWIKMQEFYKRVWKYS